MTPKFSVYLDLLRFLAAVLVFVSHFAYPRFTQGHYIFIRDLNLGSDAVVFFFVLSGLVISYTTEVKDKTLAQYSFNRFTRLYSVIVPALLLTVLLDQAGQMIRPENYQGWWYNDAPVWQQLLRGLTLTNEWFMNGFRVGTNGPYWSLSYEAAYYVLFGIFFYMKGQERLWLLLFLSIIFGVAVLVLFPAWLLGGWVYRQIKTIDMKTSMAWFFVVFPLVAYGLFLGMNLPVFLKGATIHLLGDYFTNGILRFSDEFIWNLIIAVLISFHLIGAAVLMQRRKKELPSGLVRIIRWCAGATFTIYVVHYPLLQFMDSALPETLLPVIRHLTLFYLTLTLCFLFAEISERRLSWFRRKLSTP